MRLTKVYEELVKRLREWKCDYYLNDDHEKLVDEAADAIEDLIAALTASNEVIAKNKPRWIPVTERLPEKYQYAVCWVNDEENKRGFYGIGSLSRIGDWYVDGDDYSENGNLHVTNWMPLPQPPKEETIS